MLVVKVAAITVQFKTLFAAERKESQIYQISAWLS